MSVPSNDPQLQKFLEANEPPKIDGDSPQLRQFIQYGSQQPYRRPFDRWAKIGLGAFVFFIVLRIVIKLLANLSQSG